MQPKLINGIGAAAVAIGLGVATSFAQSNTGTLNAVNNSGVNGTYRFERISDNQTRVVVDLNGMQPNSTHAGHFHTGMCDNPGPITLSLSQIKADTSGKGNVSTVVNSSLQNIYNGQYILNYHESNADTSQSMACTDIPAQTVSAYPTGSLIPSPTPVVYQAPSTGLGGTSR